MTVRQLEPKATPALHVLQGWFSTALSRPLLPGNETRVDGILEGSLQDEAASRIRSANNVSGFERLSLYNRQYWFRLIDCMQGEYPCTVHTLGLNPFNSWVIRFLEAMPSDSPYLSELDTRFYNFMESQFQAPNREVVLESIVYDQAFSQAFSAPLGKPILLENAGTAPMLLGKQAIPLWLHWDFQSYRVACRNDEPLTGTFPLLPKEYGVMVYRRNNTLYEKEISKPAFHILKALQKPYTLEELFAALEPEISNLEMGGWEENVATWFQEWVVLGWLCTATR